MLQSPLGVALALMTAYYLLVGLQQKLRSRRGAEAWLGALVFACLAAAAAVWPAVAASA